MLLDLLFAAAAVTFIFYYYYFLPAMCIQHYLFTLRELDTAEQSANTLCARRVFHRVFCIQ